jgi:hypothetical protein
MATAVFGREAELGAVESMLTAARDGLAALVLEGDPGIGKTTVWREGIVHAAKAGYRVLSCRAATRSARCRSSAGAFPPLRLPRSTARP